MPLLAAGGRVSDGTAAIKKLAQNLAILLPMGIAADCARPSDTLAAEKNFSDAHVVRKIKLDYFWRACRQKNDLRCARRKYGVFCGKNDIWG